MSVSTALQSQRGGTVKGWLRNLGSSTVGVAGARFGTFLNAAILARLLGAHGLGQYSTAWSTISLFSSIAMLGIHTATARTTAHLRACDRRDLSEQLANALLLAGGASAIVMMVPLLAGDAIARGFLHSADFGPLLRLAAWNVPLLALFQVTLSILQGFEDFRAYRQSLVWSSVLLVPITFMLGRAKGTFGALVALLVANLLGLAISGTLVLRCFRRNGVHLAWRANWASMKAILRLSLPLSLSSWVAELAWWLGNLYLARTRGFTQVSYYAAGFAVFQALQLLPMAVSVPALPALTAHIARNDQPGYGRLLSLTIRGVWAVALPACAVVCAFATPICVHLLGPSYAPAAGALRWMALAGLMSAVCGLFGPAFVSTGRTWALLGLSLTWFALICAFGLLLIPGGAAGMAKAVLAAYTALALLAGSLCNRHLRPRFLRLLAALVCLMGAAYTLIQYVSHLTLAAMLAGCIAWALVGFAVSGMIVLNAEERHLLIGGFFRQARS
jgi:O-antigen/teichoic acid export membrane protein